MDTGRDEPDTLAASLLVNCIDDEVSVVELDKPSDTVATTPVAIGVESGPDSTHVMEPALVLQKMDLFAAVAAGPAANVTDEKSTMEYAKVHSTEAGAFA